MGNTLLICALLVTTLGPSPLSSEVIPSSQGGSSPGQHLRGLTVSVKWVGLLEKAALSSPFQCGCVHHFPAALWRILLHQGEYLN